MKPISIHLTFNLTLPNDEGTKQLLDILGVIKDQFPNISDADLEQLTLQLNKSSDTLESAIQPRG